METILKFGTQDINWDELDQIFQNAPLGNRPAQMFKAACDYSPVVVTAWKGQELVGFGRAITDLVLYASIHDVVVRHDCQGEGVGQLIVEKILEKIWQCKFITLFVVPEKAEFYKKLCFRKLDSSMVFIKDQAHQEMLLSRGYIK